MQHVIIFVDIRNFTSWSNDVEIAPYLGEFASQFQILIRKHFETKGQFLEPALVKNQGDGAMIVLKIKEQISKQVLHGVIKEITEKIKSVDARFKAMCIEMGENKGCAVNLSLGWGITKGVIYSSSDGDYIGSAINRSARLCDMARPCGIVIDSDNFQNMENCPYDFYSQSRKLKGIQKDVNVWVTQDIYTQLVTRERLRQTPEVHVAGVCYNCNTDKVLVAKRADNRRIHPGKYEGCGGQLAHNESFTDGVERHFRLEFQLIVKALSDIHVFYTINQANEPIIPGIFFLCIYKNGNAASPNHPELKWISVDELDELRDSECVPNFRSHVKQMIDEYKKKN